MGREKKMHNLRPVVRVKKIKLMVITGKTLVSGIMLTTLFITLAARSQFAQPRNAVSPKFRSIIVRTEPESTIWIDNVRYGTTDKDGKLEITTFAAGAHTLRARADGFREKTQALTAVQYGEVKIALVKTTDQAELTFQEAERLAIRDREKAVDAYNRAIKLRPNYPEAYLALARVLLDSGDLDGAEKAISSAKKLRPLYPEATAVMGRIHVGGADEAKAVAIFKRAITEGGGFQPEAYAGLGILYKEKAEGFGSSDDYEQETANYTEAAKYLRSAIKQLAGAPDAIAIYQLLGLISERQKKYAEAIAIYEEFLRIFPNTPEATAVRSFIVQIKKELEPHD